MLKIMLKEKVRGSISILLIIVMMPMMAVASIIVDASGYELSKSMVSSASDLTMNTALSYYDETLQEVYGIFGVSTTTEELQNNLKNYFVDSLVANGIISDEEEYENSEMLQSLGNVFSGNVGNVIDIDASADTSVTLTGLEGTAVSEPEVLKTQIVEFMKYRTPIYGTMTLLDGIGSLKKISEQSKVTKAQAEVSEAIGDFNESCESAYKKIKAMLDYYENNKNGIVWENDFAKEDYEAIHFVVIYVYGKKITDLSFELCFTGETDEKACEYMWRFYQWYTKGMFVGNVNFETGEVSKKDKFSYEDSNGKDFYKKLTTSEKDNASENMSILITEVMTSNEWSQLEKIDNALFKNGEFDATIYDTINGFVTNLNNLKDKVKMIEAYYDYICEEGKNTVTDDSIYMDFMNQMFNYYEEGRLFSYIFEYMKTEASGLCKEVSDEIISRKACVTDYKKKVTEAKQSITKLLENLGNIASKNNDFKTTINNYNGSDKADSFGSQMQLEATYNDESFSEEEIKKLKKKIEAMETALTSLEKQYDNITYCGESVRNIDSVKKAYNAYQEKVGNYYVPTYTIETDIGYIDENEYTFWRYLKKAFKDVDTKADDSSEQKNASSIVSNVNSNAQSALSKENSLSLGTMVSDESKQSLPSAQYQAEQSKKVDVSKISIGGGSGKAGKYKGFATMLDNMSTVVTSLFSKEEITKALENTRDNLYVTDYTFQMFSYYTYEKEKKEEADRVTITGQPINAKNNQLYGAEVEYIIFGGDGASSVDSALNYIFAIRFMCNSVYAVTSGSIDAYTVPPAVAIQSATCGIVPYKLPELVFEMALALAETYVDLANIKNGEQVPLFKNPDTWSMSLKGAVKLTADAVKNKVTEAVGETKDKLISSFNEVVNSAGTTVTSNVEKWTEDYKAAISSSINEGVSTLISKMNMSMLDEIEAVLQNVNGDIQGITSDTIINNAWNSVETYLNSLGEENVIYKIANNANAENILKGYMSEYKVQLDEALNKLKNKTEGAYTAVRDIELTITNSIMGKVDSFLKDCSDTINGVVTNVTGAYQQKLKDEFGTATEVAADKVIEVTNSCIEAGANTLISKLGISDVAIGSGSVKQNSLLTFGYTDYLKMFLFLKLSTNSNAVMCRIADVIQMNMDIQNGTKESYMLSNVYTYVELKVNVRYNTLFLSDDWFSNVTGETKAGLDITYTGVRGY